MKSLCINVKMLLGVLALVWAGSINAFSQEPPYVVDSSNKGGEYTGAILAMARQGAANLDKPIILIAHLGDGEVKRDLNRMRLKRVCYGIKLDYERACKNFALAEGERVKGQGSVDVYVDGKLFAIIRSERNRYLCQSCCDSCITIPPWDRASRKYKSKKR